MFFYLIFDIKRQFFVFLKISAVFGKKSIFNACLLAEEYTVRRTFVKSIFHFTSFANNYFKYSR